MKHHTHATPINSPAPQMRQHTYDLTKLLPLIDSLFDWGAAVTPDSDDEPVIDSLILSQMTNQLPVEHEFDHSKLLLAVLPVAPRFLGEPPLQLVITTDSLHLLDRTQAQIINDSFKHHEHIAFDNAFRSAAATLLKGMHCVHASHNIPMANWRFTLIPLKPSEHWENQRLWINPATIENYSQDLTKGHHDCTQANKLLITTYGLMLKGPVRPDTLKSQIIRGILIHSARKRMHEAVSPGSDTPLMSYLEYPSTPLLNRIFGGLTTYHIPGTRSQLMDTYRIHTSLADNRSWVRKEEHAQEKHRKWHQEMELADKKHPCQICGRE